MSLPGYDAWKTTPPDDDRCEFCGAGDPGPFAPDACTGECGITFRDPDAEYKRRKED